jgi:putative ABC transport system permease protein
MSTELRHAIRALAHDRGYSSMVVLSLAVGIGANTAIFSLVNGVLLRPPAYRDPERLAGVTQIIPKFAKAYPAIPLNLGIWSEWRKQAKSFEDIAVARPDSANLSGAGEPELLSGARISANLLPLLGVQPRLGRSFLEREDADGSERVVMLSDSLWRRRFQADPSVVGRKMLLDGTPYEVVGVLPPDFLFPTRSGLFSDGARKIEIFRSLRYRPDDLRVRMGDFNYWATARLRPGVTRAQATAEMNVLQAAISKRIPPGDLDLHANVAGVVEQMVGDVRRGLVLMMAAVGAVLLVLWVNLANLSLVRAAARARDAAIRTALGAGQWRLVGQSVAESLLLSIAGGGLGVLLAWSGVRALVASAPVDMPRLNEVRMDPRVLFFALGVSLGAGLLLGILPALRAAAAAPFEALKSGSRSNTEGRAGLRVRNTLVSLEVGLSATLLVTAALLSTSFVRLMSVDRGFDVERVLALDLSLPGQKYAKGADRSAFYQRLLERAANLPGVQSASMVSVLPLQGESWIDLVGAEKDTRSLIERPSANVRFIAPGYFQTLRVALEEGRDIGEQDHGRKVVVLSAGLARKIWPGQDALGRKIESNDQILEVVGITADIRSTALDREPVNMLYQPYWQNPQPGGSLLVRTAADPRGLASALRRTVWDLEGEAPIRDIRTLEEVMSRSVAGRRFQVLLIAVFAAAALVLAAFGTYGVVSYAVARRRAEMGIRMALGASRGDVLRMVLGQGMLPVGVGLVAGGLGALALGRYLSTLLFEVSPRDPWAFAAAAAVLLAVAAVACLAPARRATRVNPIEALRFE